MTHWIKRVLAPGTTNEAPPEEVEEWFSPRTDGIYIGGPDPLRHIKFGPGHGVWITDATNTALLHTPLPKGAAVLTTTWTGAGRFSVSRPFERPIVFVVVGNNTDDQLTLRITDTNTQHTADHQYRFTSGT